MGVAGNTRSGPPNRNTVITAASLACSLTTEYTVP